MLDLAEYEAGIGPCGMHHDWTMDPATEAHLTFEEETCPACAAMERRRRFIDDRNHRRTEGRNLKPGMPHPGDGMLIRLRAMTPAEVELMRRSSASTP